MKFHCNLATAIIFIVIGAILACHTVCGCTNFYVSKKEGYKLNPDQDSDGAIWKFIDPKYRENQSIVGDWSVHRRYFDSHDMMDLFPEYRFPISGDYQDINTYW